MKKSKTLGLVAVLALSIGLAYAAPMIIAQMNIQLLPNVLEGPKAEFTVDVVYADFNTVDYQRTDEFYNQDGSLNHAETYPATNVTYNVVLRVTNPSDQPATLYEVTFAAGQDISVKDSILGGTIYDFGFTPENPFVAGRHFGGIVDGVYLDGKWVNVTWIPEVQYEDNGTMVTVQYPLNLFSLTQSSWQGGIISGPLSPENIAAFSVNHNLNGTIPDLPANASETGVWFEGIPITEYYDQYGNPLVTEMYINGAWVDVTGRVTVDNAQPMTTVSNMLVNEVFTFGAQPYANMNSTVGPVTALPTWGNWGTGRTFFWFPWDYGSQPFNSTFAPHESRLIAFNHTQPFIMMTEDSPPSNGIAALKSANLQLYASASNYITNWPVNGTYYNTVSTTTQITMLQFEQTPNGYVFNAILDDNQVFQRGNSNYEVIVAPRIEP
ncbi:MAG: hypothetical protein M1540_03930 [Candidatus Bathyarchaeota archaeon]|nr:hypothetical protein [Candidatus Bathyarchaeota archaeon]